MPAARLAESPVEDQTTNSTYQAGSQLENDVVAYKPLPKISAI